MVLPPSLQKLASGWLARLYREGVEPSGSLQEVSDHISPPPLLDLSWRKGSFILNLPLASLDHLVGAEQNSSRYGHAKRLGGFEIDHCLECGRLLDRQICGLFAFHNSSGVDADMMIGGAQARSVAHQAAGQGKFTPSEDRRNGMARGQQHELIAPDGKELVGLHDEPADALIDDGRQGRVDLAVAAYVEDAHRLPDPVGGGLHVA